MEREGTAYEQPEQARGVARIVGIGGGGKPGAALYRQRPGQDRATVWWTQGFVPEEDDAFRKIVADYEKISGNKIDFSIMPFAPLRQKIISAITSGVVPDLTTVTPTEAARAAGLARQAGRCQRRRRDAKGEDEPGDRSANAYCYNNVEKKRAYYCVPHSARR